MALTKHLQNGHDIPKDQLNEYIIPSDDEMDGAVHVDGFLRPIKNFRKPKQRREVEIKEESMSEDDDRFEENQTIGVSDDEGDERNSVPEHGSPSPMARTASNNIAESEEDHTDSDASANS